MWIIDLSFITGMSVGIEFIDKEKTGGLSGVTIDLVIVRFGLWFDHEAQTD